MIALYGVGVAKFLNPFDRCLMAPRIEICRRLGDEGRPGQGSGYGYRKVMDHYNRMWLTHEVSVRSRLRLSDAVLIIVQALLVSLDVDLYPTHLFHVLCNKTLA